MCLLYKVRKYTQPSFLFISKTAANHMQAMWNTVLWYHFVTPALYCIWTKRPNILSYCFETKKNRPETNTSPPGFFISHNLKLANGVLKALCFINPSWNDRPKRSFYKCDLFYTVSASSSEILPNDNSKKWNLALHRSLAWYCAPLLPTLIACSLWDFKKHNHFVQEGNLLWRLVLWK